MSATPPTTRPEDRTTATAALDGRVLHKHYGEGESLVRAVDGVDIVVAHGEHVAIMGPSGCGKSTLLHVLGGLEHLTSGTLYLDGARVDGLSETRWALLRRRCIGFVFQAFNLIDELTAVENVELPALLAGDGASASRRRAAELLDRVELTDRADHLPAQLSGGQRQRVAIARALVNEPVIVFADEPTGNLDSAATNDILRLFADLRSSGQTLVMVTHDERVATTADRLLSMRDGEIVDETCLTDFSSPGRRCHRRKPCRGRRTRRRRHGVARQPGSHHRGHRCYRRPQAGRLLRAGVGPGRTQRRRRDHRRRCRWVRHRVASPVGPRTC